MSISQRISRTLHQTPLLTLNRRTLFTVSSLLILVTLLEAVSFIAGSITITDSLETSSQVRTAKVVYEKCQESHLNFLLYLQGRQPSTRAITAPLEEALTLQDRGDFPPQTVRLSQSIREEMEKHLRTPAADLRNLQRESWINDQFFLLKQELEGRMSRQQDTIHSSQERVGRILRLNTGLLIIILFTILTLHAFTLLYRRTLSRRFSLLQGQVNQQILKKEDQAGDSPSRRLREIDYSLEDEFQPLVRGFNQLVRQVQEQQETLKAKNIQLKEGLLEKESLLKEVHHRVKNNLQVIISLLHLQGQEAGGRAAEQALEDSQNRIRSMAMVHQRLYQTSRLNRINLRDYLQDLAEDIRRAHIGTHPAAAELSLQADPLEISAEQAIPLGLAVNEMLSTAIRRSSGTPGSSLDARLQANGKTLSFVIREIVRDDGQPPPSFSDTETLSTSLAGILAEQLGGSLTVQNGPPRQWELQIPWNKL